MDRSILSDGATYQYVIKNTAGKLLKITAMNNAASTRFVKIYNSGTNPSPADISQAAPRWRLMLFKEGGIIENLNLNLNNGIAIVVVTGAADTDVAAATANDCMLNFEYE